jgi:hypothetical protein
MASWPTTLPLPTIQYGLKPVDPVIRTEMDTGLARSRRRTFARDDKVSVVWQLSDAQMTIFRAWFDNPTTGANGGAAWFTTNLPLGTGGIISTTARFVGIFNASYSEGFRWAVSAELEIM